MKWKRKTDNLLLQVAVHLWALETQVLFCKGLVANGKWAPTPSYLLPHAVKGHSWLSSIVAPLRKWWRNSEVVFPTKNKKEEERKKEQLYTISIFWRGNGDLSQLCYCLGIQQPLVLKELNSSFALNLEENMLFELLFSMVNKHESFLAPSLFEVHPASGLAGFCWIPPQVTHK